MITTIENIVPREKVISELKEQNKRISEEVKKLKKEIKIKGSMASEEKEKSRKLNRFKIKVSSL